MVEKLPVGNLSGRTTVSIEEPTYGLHFKGKTEGGKEVLVPYTLPGEVWEVQHLKEKVYKPLRWIKLNWNDRRVAPCGYFPRCCGCQWQHIKPESQLEFKLRLFKKFTGLGQPDIILTSPSEFHYRVRTLLYFKGGVLGHRRSWIFDLEMKPFPLDYCPLLHPKANGVIKLLQEFTFPDNLHAVEIFVNPQNGEVFLKFLIKGNIRKEPVEFAEMLTASGILSRRKHNIAGVGLYKGQYLHWERKITLGKWESEIKINGFSFKISPDSFLQPNYLLWEPFQNLVKPLSESYKKAVELHAGVGFFTPNIARYTSGLVESSDINPISAKLREENLKSNGIDNVKSFISDAYKHIKMTRDFDLLVVDPPRGGLTEPVLREILKKQPEEIIYISCNLRSLSRDLKTLKANYKVMKTAVVEQFPNTYHIESVIWLKRT